MARVALIGANGQLGTDITRLWADSDLGKRGDELIGLTHADIEITDSGLIVYAFRDVKHLGEKPHAKGVLDA